MSVWPSDSERSSALAVLASVGADDSLLHLLDEQGAVAAVDDGSGEPADEPVVEVGCSTMLASALVGIGTFAQNAEARGPRDMPEEDNQNQGVQSMVGRSHR